MTDLCRIREVTEFIEYLVKATRSTADLKWEKTNTSDSFVHKVNDSIWISIAKVDDFDGMDEPDYTISIYNGKQELATLDRRCLDNKVIEAKYGTVTHLLFKEIFDYAKYTANDLKGVFGQINTYFSKLIK